MGDLEKILRDWQFYLCLGLAPITWLCLALLVPMRDDFVGLLNNSLQLVMLVAVYPILEEVVFRGLILDGLSRWTKGRHYGLLTEANFLTSILFVLAHLIYQPWLWALLVFFPSIVFGYMKERHHSLLPPIVLHSFYNFGFILFFA